MTTSGSAFFRRIARFAAPALLATAIPGALGQATPTATNGPSPSRVDIYGGYAYFRPYNSDINNNSYQTLPQGSVVSVAGYFSRHWGLQGEGTAFINTEGQNDCEYSGQAGPIFRLPEGRWVPYIHLLGGAAQVGGPALQPCNVWGYGATFGTGVDFVLPFWNNHLAIRPAQVDLTYSHIDNGALVLPGGLHGGVGEITAIRLSGGIVYRIGQMQPSAEAAPTLTCAVTPAEAYVGDPVTITATGLNIGKEKDEAYVFTTTAGPLTAAGASATVDSSKATPGNYTVGAALNVGKKQRQLASCTADFKILEFEPPVIACAANRSSINSGDPVIITSTARSPQNLGLTYSYTSTKGQISGSGTSATLATTGASPGAITVTCSVVDAKGRTASATTSVVVATPPPPPPAAEARSLCGVSFDRDRARPVRVDNEAKGCLDDIALTMNRETGSKLLIVGNRAPGESQQEAGARALNVSDYLVKEKGIDGSRLELRIGDEPSRTVTNTIVPPGAMLDAGRAAAFDGKSIRRRGEPYGTPR